MEKLREQHYLGLLKDVWVGIILPLSKHCKNEFSSSKKTKHPFSLHTPAQGQGRGAKLLPTLPVLKIILTHLSTSLCTMSQPQPFYTRKFLWDREGSQQIQDRTWRHKHSRTCPTGICESRAAPGIWWEPWGHRPVTAAWGEDEKAEGGKFWGMCSIGEKITISLIRSTKQTRA